LVGLGGLLLWAAGCAAACSFPPPTSPCRALGQGDGVGPPWCRLRARCVCTGPHAAAAAATAHASVLLVRAWMRVLLWRAVRRWPPSWPRTPSGKGAVGWYGSGAAVVGAAAPAPGPRPSPPARRLLARLQLVNRPCGWCATGLLHAAARDAVPHAVPAFVALCFHVTCCPFAGSVLRWCPLVALLQQWQRSLPWLRSRS
jgi:hypothetical protein